MVKRHIERHSSDQMNNVVGFKCVECAGTYDVAEIEYICPACGGNLDVLYDYDWIRKRLSRDSLSADRDFSMWRYRALLPVAEMSRVPQLSVGWTPVYECPRLAYQYGIGELLIKDEGRNPTGSLKDRPSALAVVKARETGQDVIATASSGNAGSALAGMCASTQLRSVIFLPSNVPAAKLAQLQVYGATIAMVEGTYDQAYDLCLEAARQFNWYQRNTGHNPYMTEGKKTAALEIAEQLNWQVPDKVFVAMGDGCIIGGLWKGFCDLHQLGFIERLPQMIGVQAENAAAIVATLNGEGSANGGAAKTIADSICVGKPRDAVKAVQAIRESTGFGIKVSDAEILAAVSELARATGVFVEPSSAAAFAGFVKSCQEGRIKSDERVLLLLTGNGLKDVDAVLRTSKAPQCYPPVLEEFIDQLEKNGFALSSAASRKQMLSPT
jgi:threonine synthase